MKVVKEMNKVLIVIEVPRFDAKFDIFVPVNKKVKALISLSSKMISELSNNSFPVNGGNSIYNKLTGERYNENALLVNTDIRNSTILIMV